MVEISAAEAKQLQQYLLGLLTDTAAVEERYFRDDAYFEQLEVAEEELIRCYLRRDLSDAEKRAFEEFYLVTEERKAKVAEQRLLTQAVDSIAAERSGFTAALREFFAVIGPAPKAALALAGIAVLGIGIATLLRNRDLANQVAGTRHELQRAAAAANLEREARLQAEVRLSRIASARFTLYRATRGEGGPIAISPTADRVELQLAIEPTGRYAAALVRIYNAAGALTTSVALGPLDTGSPRGVEVTVPSAGLPDGHGKVEVLAGPDLASARVLESYPIAVTRR